MRKNYAIRQLDTKIKQEKIEAFNSFQFAKNVGCEEIYDSIYRLASSAIQTTSRCLADYVEADEEGNITVVNHGPDAEVTNRFVYDTSSFFIKAVRGMCELFGVDKESELSEFERKLRGTVARKE